MILVSKVLLGSATAALLAGSVVVPDVADAARELAAVLRGPGTFARAAVSPPGAPPCAGSCDVWGLLARTR